MIIQNRDWNLVNLADILEETGQSLWDGGGVCGAHDLPWKGQRRSYGTGEGILPRHKAIYDRKRLCNDDWTGRICCLPDPITKLPTTEGRLHWIGFGIVLDWFGLRVSGFP